MSVAQPAVKSINVIVPNLAPDPVSLAQTAVVDIVKSKTEGGICVSNNVIVPRLAPDQVSVAQPAGGKVSVTRLTPARGARVSVAELCGKFDDVWQNRLCELF